MANEVKISFTPSKTLYFFVLNSTGQIWNTVTSAFEAYLTANLANYTNSMTQQGAASSIYLGSMPTAIPNGTYDFIAKQQLGGAAAETDPTVGSEDGFGWNGSTRIGFSDFPISGQIRLVNIPRGCMTKNFPVYLKSSADHVTPFVSGIVSGQIVRDAVSGSVFGPLQSGAFVEVGNGFYSLQALTSGDALANTIMLLFTANGISGGSSDPLPIGIITQRTSGQ